MNPKDLLDTLELQIKRMEYRDLVPNPEDNKNVKSLIQMMSLSYKGW